MKIDPELRAVWRSLAFVAAGQPGHDYDRGYLTGWYDVRRGIRRRLPRGTFRGAERVDEFRLGYRQGRADGKGRLTDWWPDHALGRIDAAGHAVAGSGAGPLAARLARSADVAA